LIECVNNFINWSGATIPQVLKAVTATPAAMLGLRDSKGTLDAEADADLVIFSEEGPGDDGTRKLVIDEVWKFGAKVFDRGTG
jgi:N-acetylglucosamine-6-phosphate deacetylase